MIHRTTPIEPLLDQLLMSLKAREYTVTAMEGLWTELALERARVSPHEWAEIGEACRAHPLFTALLEDPITRQAYEKPRGYAGDAVLMDLIYSALPPVDMSPTGRRVHSFVSSRPCGRGARARKSRLARMLSSSLMNYERPEILSVACGHMRELQLVSPDRLDRAERIVAFDQDPASLTEVSRSMGSLDALSLAQGSVRRLIAGEHDLGQFDLIYSLGLYDYLEQPAAQRLTQVLFAALKPGGRLLIANFLPITSSGYMEAFMQWDLVYRNREEIMDLAGELGVRASKDARYIAEHSGTIGFLELSRAATCSIAA